jgi:hypothetical protein
MYRLLDMLLERIRRHAKLPTEPDTGVKLYELVDPNSEPKPIANTYERQIQELEARNTRILEQRRRARELLKEENALMRRKRA